MIAYLHHVLIHFPIALSLVATLLAMLSWRRPDGAWVRSVQLASYLAGLSAVASAATGLLCAGHAIEGGLAPDAVDLHRNVALVATALLVLSAMFMRVGAGKQGRAAQIGAGLGLAGALVVTAAAHFGGDMLHPGLAPWSKEKHSHGPADSHMHDHGAAMSSPASDAATTMGDDAGDFDARPADAPAMDVAAADGHDAGASADAGPPAPAGVHTHRHGEHSGH